MIAVNIQKVIHIPVVVVYDVDVEVEMLQRATCFQSTTNLCERLVLHSAASK